MSSSEILLRVSDMVEEVPISKLSDDDFTKEECEALCRRVKYRWLKWPTIAELGLTARSLHEDITKDVSEQSRLLNEVPQVLADTVEVKPTYEDPIRKGDGDTSEVDLESTADLSNDDCGKSSEAISGEWEADWSIDAIRSTMTPTSLETLERSYGIPKNIVLRLPKKGHLASSPPQGAVTLHSTLFEFGIKLPFHPFLREFQQLYQLKIHPKSRGWYCLSPWPGKEAMVIDSPSSNKNWKKKWFFDSGHWEADPNQQDLEHRIPTAFRTPATWKKPPELTAEQKNIKTAFAIPSKDRSCRVLLTPKNLKGYWFTSTSTMSKRYHPEKIPVGVPIKVSTKKMKVRISSQEGSPPVSENNPPRHATVHLTPSPTSHGSPIPPVVLEPEEKYLACLANEWRRYVPPEEVEKVQMLSLEEAISIGLSHNLKAVCLALDLQERMNGLALDLQGQIKSFENDKKILIDQVNQAVEKNSKLQGQLDEEKAMSARLRERIADLKATVIDATSRAEGAVARADAAERDNKELRKVNKELNDGITSWEDAAIK
ncbi:hypothetical protein LWI28_014375 [Acer negundo]|uniref:Uncharacterized protein n=1 Tax=Acer negundo TaxID=4023 RepID=A0AAD5NS52_ACENE|nr:hypothetical protein LWI28_014375 [Acer negundo]